MNVRESPFPLGWYTPGAHPDFWGDAGTYTLIAYDDLPPLESSGSEGSFDWLTELPDDDDALAFEDVSVSPMDQMMRLADRGTRLGLSIPTSFFSFMSSPAIHRRIPTCTACYLDLPNRLVEVPGVAGRLLRFMNDQQSVLLWYLYLVPNGEHAVVVATPEWDEDADGDTLEDVVRLTDIVLCAPTFDAFIHRFWLENTIWYALYEGRQMTGEQKRYLDAVHTTR
jgi:hypothetical protein